MNEAKRAATELRRRLRNAKQLWRLCAAAEDTLARLGSRTVVQDVLNTAGMSRRDFYLRFDNLDQMLDAMNTVAEKWKDRAAPPPRAPWVRACRFPRMACLMEADALVQAFQAARARVITPPEDEDLLAWAEAITDARDLLRFLSERRSAHCVHT